jgi:hypothetical protein
MAPPPSGGEALDKKAFSEIEGRLLEVNKVIAKLDSSIRVAAFEFLKSYVSGGTLRTIPSDPSNGPDDEPSIGDLSDLIQAYPDQKPHENVNLLAAHWFSEYGSHPFTTRYIREQASASGLTVSARIDKALNTAREKGKKLYEAGAKKAMFKPTVVGEAFFKATYHVKKGTKTPPAEK